MRGHVSTQTRAQRRAGAGALANGAPPITGGHASGVSFTERVQGHSPVAFSASYDPNNAI